MPFWMLPKKLKRATKNMVQLLPKVVCQRAVKNRHYCEPSFFHSLLELFPVFERWRPSMFNIIFEKGHQSQIVTANTQ